MTQFIFDSYLFDRASREISFSYSIVRHDSTYHLKEIIKLPNRSFADYSDTLLQPVLQATHIALGTSYWKVFCPSEIVLQQFTLSLEQAEYWNTVYTKGLGEFFYRNHIDFRKRISFPHDSSYEKLSSERKKSGKFLVGVGGGKDSAVTVELLRDNNFPVEGFVVETGKSYPVIDEMIKASDISSLRFVRHMDPQISDLNAHPDAFNGHIPISSIYTWLGMTASVLYGFDGFIASNERSANIGNVQYLGMEVNHQWSKSFEFEMMTRTYLNSLSETPLEYVSLLRPYSEYAIVEKFIAYPHYFEIFSSCNRNFSQSVKAEKKWCGECPKCAFVFALLSAHLPQDKVLNIFGENLFKKESLRKVYRELLGLEGIKPFECVGTPEETSYAFWKIYERGDMHKTPMMKLFIQEILPSIDKANLHQEVTRVDKDVLPEKFQNFL